MGRIHLLSPLVQNQIAAGEVVERPLSVLKELVENSIDAGATEISVLLEDGGTTCIKVTDNGSGMDTADAELAFVRHATSKISDIHDLQHIHSMGFRGEALASISSVAKVRLKTRTGQQHAGVEVTAEGEQVSSPIEVGASVGTSIEVRDLFFNVPARKKYLRSAKTELTYCMKYMTEVAILYPDIRFYVQHGERALLTFPSTTLEERIKAAVSKNFFDTHTAVDFQHPDLRIHGFISKPHVQLTSKNRQYLYINNRPVKSEIIQKAITKSYRRILDEGRYPTFLLFIESSPELVDVNVHPRKLEVRFHDTQFIFSAVQNTIEQALTRAGSERILHSEKPVANQDPLASSAPTNYDPTSKATSPYAAAFKQATPQRGKFSQGAPQQSMEHIIRSAPLTLRESKRSSMPSPLSQSTFQHSQGAESGHTSGKTYKILGQLLSCYILVETQEGLLLVDQHAAHERILFDKLTLRSEQKDTHVQQLITPELLHLTPADAALTENYAPLLREAGFHVEMFDASTWTLDAIPHDLAKKNIDIESTFHTLLHECEDMSTGCSSTLLTDYREKLLAYTACRSAIKFGDVLNMEEMENIIQDLFATERRYTCPHGRTSMIRLDKSQLARFFDR